MSETRERFVERNAIEYLREFAKIELEVGHMSDAAMLIDISRRIAMLEAQLSALRKFTKAQLIFTGNGGWATLTDAQIDAALPEVKQ